MKDNNILILNKIKSKYIIKIIFQFIKKHKKLNVINYNKKLQKDLDIKLKDYIDYYQINAEIIIMIQKNIKPIDKLIDINKNLYNLYIDDKLFSIDSNNNNINKLKSSKLKFVIKNGCNSLMNLFQNLIYIQNISFIRFVIINITDMSSMFSGCSNLSKLNLSYFKTNNVINMKNMFYECSSLIEIDLSNFKTNNVNNMGYMFYKCKALTKLNLSNFNVENVKYVNSMFEECTSLKIINLSNFQAKKLINMNRMFYNCTSLEVIITNNFYVPKIRNNKNIFKGCNCLKNLEELKKIFILNE